MPAQRSVLITGCSDGGIGAALAHAFAEREFHVFATARDPAKMASLAVRPNVTLLKLDVTKSEHITQAVKVVSGETGSRLDFLINNAGRNHFMPLLDESLDRAREIFNTNVWGALALVQAFSPLLIAAKGTIVSVTSISGHLNMPWMGTYAASKRSMEIMAETLRLEMRPFGVRVMSLVTGPVRTNGLDYFDDFKLPAMSLYASIESIIYGRAHGAGAPEDRMSATAFADKVVPSILREAQSGLVWGPDMISKFVQFATSWLPQGILDSMWIKGTGVDRMLS